MYRILLLEDEETIREMITLYLEKAGYKVYGFDNGLDAINQSEQIRPHLAILDIMMPGITGIDVLKEIRRTENIPVIMLTAMSEEPDRLKGFELGADDYITKPFSVRELAARVKVFLTRTYEPTDKKEKLVYKALELDINEQKLYKNGNPIETTAREFEILLFFFRHIGQPLTREQIIEEGISADFDGYDRGIDSFIKKLRIKIEDDRKNPKYIKTKYGYGYIFGGDYDDH
jgi:DNA-binding response OmpR family regulator